jgi:hypothetical protein
VRNVEAFQRSGAQAENVGRLVREEVARILVSLDLTGDLPVGPVGHAAAVGMEESAEEPPGVQIDHSLLPRLQHDRTSVLTARPMLGKQAGPVLRVTLHGD